MDDGCTPGCVLDVTFSISVVYLQLISQQSDLKKLLRKEWPLA